MNICPLVTVARAINVIATVKHAQDLRPLVHLVIQVGLWLIQNVIQLVLLLFTPHLPVESRIAILLVQDNMCIGMEVVARLAVIVRVLHLFRCNHQPKVLFFDAIFHAVQASLLILIILVEPPALILLPVFIIRAEISVLILVRLQSFLLGINLA